ncbi:ATP-binding protein [Sediminibacterium sp. C3]|uniref:sensor histidine kinase n=1 Tax=Sediminibacterium sp. C3 TaxID=1267211 RepID=UPI00047EC9C9|nr:hybrid sensor histidine kinase/response regulator [Sediminibacterium sp. C3]
MSQVINTDNFLILLVDDRPENLIALEEILAQPGRSFIKASSGNEALKLALKYENIGLVMLDVQMPEMDGFEVARMLQLNKKTQHLSIIFVTAISKEEKFVLKGFEEGAVDYLQKPLDINITRAKVKVFERLYFAQQRLKQSLLETELVNKQLERFVFIVSHDLKSPVATIAMLADMMQKEDIVKNEPELLENTSIIYSSASRLTGMIESILDYSRKSLNEQVVEEVNAYDLVNDIVKMLSLKPNTQLHIDENLPKFRTRKIKLQQVFQNLLSNAIKYNNNPNPEISIGLHSTNSEFYIFYVKDNGQGISRQDQNRIFKLFETTDNKASGESSTGIGLNLLKMLVEEQGGKIKLESSPETGSTFYFEWRK